MAPLLQPLAPPPPGLLPADAARRAPVLPEPFQMPPEPDWAHAMARSADHSVDLSLLLPSLELALARSGGFAAGWETGGMNSIQGSPGAGTLPIASSVPEPASWALLVAAFGLIGGRLRMRRASGPEEKGRRHAVAPPPSLPRPMPGPRP
jgi:hypothetical protein